VNLERMSSKEMLWEIY